MPLKSIKLRPGLFSVATPTLNEIAWQSASNIRFFQSMAEQDAGFVDIVDDPTIGPVRALKSWAGLNMSSALSWLVIAGDDAVKVFADLAGVDSLTDITPAGYDASVNVSADVFGTTALICAAPSVYSWSYGDPAAIIIPVAHPNANSLFVAAQQQVLVLLGSYDDTGAINPMCVRFSDIGNYLILDADVDNQAGDFILSSGSKIVAGLAVPGQNYIWTDTTVYSMSYIQFPLVWGFQPLGVNCGAVGTHAVGILAGAVYWKGQNQFFVFGPNGPQQIECPVWDEVFPNQDMSLGHLVVREPDSFYGEIGWSVPQINGQYIFARFNPATNAWTADSYHHHTAWIDQNSLSISGNPARGAPIGGHERGVVDQHDVGYNANGSAPSWSLTSGIAMISEGDETTFVSDLIPDFKVVGDPDIAITLYAYDYPSSAPRVHGPFIVNSETQVIHPRCRARGIQIKMEGGTLDCTMRLGNIRVRGQPDGKR